MTEVANVETGVRDESLERALRRLDSYRVERVLAERPGFTTELASHPRSDGSLEYVVLKHVALEFANPGLWERYGTVRRGHLPRLVEVIELPDEHVVALQFIKGESLADYVGRLGPLDPRTARAILDDLCDAVSALAEVGIVHRDIKPSNVILAFDGAYLIDPGIARVADQSIADGPRDRDTTILGSWGYASPEQLGFAPTDERSDVFSLSRLLGFMLTGLSPTDPAYLEALRDTARIPEALRLVVARGSALEPSQRPTSAAALRQLLDIESQRWIEPSAQPLPEGLGPRRRSSAPIDPSTQGNIPVARPPAGSRSHRGAIAGAVAFFGFFGTYFCFAGFFLPSTSMPRWGYALYGLAIGILGNYLPGCEIVRALRGTGIYAGNPRKRRTCMRRILKWWAICFGLLVVVSIIVRATGWR